MIRKHVILIALVIGLVTSYAQQNVGIGTNNPKNRLDVIGSSGSAITTISANTILDVTYGTIMATPPVSGTYTVTLPAAASAPRRTYIIIYGGAPGGNNIIIQSGDGASNNIFTAGTGTNSISLNDGSLVLQCDSTNWYATTVAPVAGGAGYLQNGTSVQSNANFAIQSKSASSISGVIKALSGQTADLLDFQNSGGTIITSIDKSGDLSVGSGVTTPAYPLQVTGNNATAAGYFTNSNTTAGAAALFGNETGTTGVTYGVFGSNASAAGFGVYGLGSASGGTGLYGSSSGGNGYGIYGTATGSGTNTAGYFTATGGTTNNAIIVPSGGGNVGIGTLTPGSTTSWSTGPMLDVAGNIYANDIWMKVGEQTVTNTKQITFSGLNSTNDKEYKLVLQGEMNAGTTGQDIYFVMIFNGDSTSGHYNTTNFTAGYQNGNSGSTGTGTMINWTGSYCIMVFRTDYGGCSGDNTVVDFNSEITIGGYNNNFSAKQMVSAQSVERQNNSQNQCGSQDNLVNWITGAEYEPSSSTNINSITLCASVNGSGFYGKTAYFVGLKAVLFALR